jgi:hypothetical protein
MDMKRIDPRLLIGLLLIVGGALSLLDVQGIISDAGGIFWGLVFGAGALAFLYLLFTDRANNWWAAFPGFTLLGLAASSLQPDSLEAYDGLVFFAGLSMAFWWVYFSDPQRWWAIIPAGVLLTLGIVSALEDVTGFDSGGSFFLGLGLTFILVAVLPGGRSRTWALIPGTILLLFGALLGTPFLGLAEYFWPAILIVLGVFFIIRFFRNEAPR